MKKILFFFACMLLSNAAIAQVEHGALVGANLVFPLQDSRKTYSTLEENKQNYTFVNSTRPQFTVGYRFRFLPQEQFFYDVDIRAGFQWTNSHHYNVYLGGVTEYGDGSFSYIENEDNRQFSEFLIPLSVSASWNWHISKRFHVGAGIAPTLYVSPNAVFDLGVLAKVGYRVSKHLELGLTYQYGCLNTLKHFENDGKAGRRGHLSDLMLSVYVPFHL